MEWRQKAGPHHTDSTHNIERPLISQSMTAIAGKPYSGPQNDASSTIGSKYCVAFMGDRRRDTL